MNVHNNFLALVAVWYKVWLLQGAIQSHSCWPLKKFDLNCDWWDGGAASCRQNLKSILKYLVWSLRLVILFITHTVAVRVRATTATPRVTK